MHYLQYQWARLYTPRFVASVTIVAIVGIGATGLLVAREVANQIRGEELSRAYESAALVIRPMLLPKLLGEGRRLTRAETRDLDRRIDAARDAQPMLEVEVWARAGGLLYAHGERPEHARRASPAIRAALQGGSSTAIDADGHELRAALPVTAGRRDKPIAAVLVTLPYAPVESTITRRTRRLQAIILGAGLLFYVLVLPSALKTARILRAKQGTLRRAAARDLTQAITRGEFELHYQPIASTDTRTVQGVEALVRRRASDGSFVPPGDFIPVAEETGAIWPLTLHICELALAQCQAWSRRGWTLPIAVNLSTVTLLDERLPGELARRLDACGIAPELFHLEITESAIMHEPDRALAVLADLAQLGIGVIAIDDFGTGYSSLARLHELPLDALKIDRAFVSRMASEGDQVLVSSIVALGHDLGLVVIAEGVEDELTWDTLRDLGCDSAQGYWLCRPQPAPQVERWLAEQGAPRLSSLRSEREAAQQRQQDGRLRWAAFTERRRRGREP